MPMYLYWGEDDFALEKAVDALRDRVLDPQWASFNYDKIPEDRSDAVIFGLNQAMTPPFGVGGRLVWLVDTTICHQCSEEILAELERTLPVVPESSVLLLTSRTKPDGRLRSTKLLQNYAAIKEFSLIPPWKTEDLVKRVRLLAQELGVKLTPTATELLARAVGNDTRMLHNELDKLQLYAKSADGGSVLDVEAVAALVTINTQNSFQLAAAICQGDAPRALELVADLLGRNEHALAITATLIGQFRTWLWVKLMVESGERDDRAIASSTEVGNPNRVYYLRQEVRTLTPDRLTRTMPILLELEVSLKRGADALSTLQTKVIELCQLYQY